MTGMDAPGPPGAPVLITGGAGFLGRHLAARLAAAGTAVRLLDPAPAPDLPAGVTHHRGSILEAADLDRALAGMGAIYHLAAEARLWVRDPQRFERLNHRGTVAVLDAARRHGTGRVLHCSSEVTLISRHPARVPDPVTEAAAPGLAEMCGPYPRSKWRAEAAARAAAAAGQDVVIVNPTAPVGPGDSAPTPPMALIAALLAGRIPAYVDVALDLVPAESLAEGMRLAMARGRAGRRYLLSGTHLRLSELCARLASITGRPMPRRRLPFALGWTAAAIEEGLAARLTGRPPLGSLTGLRLARAAPRFECARARAELGYAPGDLDRALAAAAAWLEKR